jgi:uncharacterized membrane protein YdjX (TVP38/TMEM64 family)
MTGGIASRQTIPWRPALATLVRVAPVFALVAVAAALYGSGAAGEVSLGNLQQHEQALRDAIAEHPALFVIAFVGLYALGTAAFVPVGMVLMLAGGLLLGPWFGAALSVLGATGGASLSYAAARFAAGGALRRRMEGGRLGAIAAGFGANAFAYVLTLRLIPLSPFGLVNVAAGLARAPFGAYLAATVLGSIPICLIYSHLGAGLGEALLAGRSADLSVMSEPRVWIPLTCLALISLAPAVFGRLRRRRG